MLTLDEWKEVGINAECTRLAIMRAYIEIHSRKLVPLPSMSKTCRRLRKAERLIDSYKCEAEAEFCKDGYRQPGIIYGTNIVPEFKTNTPFDVRDLIEQEAYFRIRMLPHITPKLIRLQEKVIAAIDEAAYMFQLELKPKFREIGNVEFEILLKESAPVKTIKLWEVNWPTVNLDSRAFWLAANSEYGNQLIQINRELKELVLKLNQIPKPGEQEAQDILHRINRLRQERDGIISTFEEGYDDYVVELYNLEVLAELLEVSVEETTKVIQSIKGG